MNSFLDFMNSALSEAGLSDEQLTAALTKIANHEKLSPKLNSLVKTATEDYNAQIGRVKAMDERIKGYESWYTEANAQYQAALNELQTLKSGTHTDPPAFDSSKYLTKDDLATFAREQATRYASTIKDATRLASRHAAKFGEELDVDAVEKIATEKNLPLTTAYDEWIRPRVEEKQKSDWEAKLKAAREEGAKEAMSRYKLPVDPVPSESSPFFSRNREAAKDLDSELFDAWTSAGKS